MRRQWKQQLLKSISQLFSEGQQKRVKADETTKELPAKSGLLTVGNNFLAKVKYSVDEGAEHRIY